MTKLVGFALALTTCACGSSATDNPDLTPDAGIDAGPPAALPDLRFKWVGAFPSYSVLDHQEVSDELLTSATGGHRSWSPLAIGQPSVASSQGILRAAWGTYGFMPAAPIVPVTGTAGGAFWTTQVDDILPVEFANVVTSLDFNSDGEWGYTASLPGSGMSLQPLAGAAATSAATLAAYVEQLAGQGFVTTALGFDGARVELATYADPNDTTTTYEASVVLVDAGSIPTMASVLGTSGYTITAFGRADAKGTFALVGTRRPGATTPRDATTIDDTSQSGAVTQVLADGYAIVGAYVDGTTSRVILER